MDLSFLPYGDEPFFIGLVALAAFGIAAAFSALRADAGRKSHCWYGCLAAPVVFLMALRKIVSLAVPGTLALFAVGLAGEVFGRVLLRGSGEPSPSRWRIAVYGTLAAALVLMTTDTAQSQPAEPDYVRLEVNEPAPPFVLRDQNGHDTRLSDFKGKVVVATFIYSTCVDVCPVLLSTLEAVEDMLTPEQRDAVRFVAVTVDPSRDTSENLRIFMAERDLNAANWVLLTGSIVDLTSVANDYGVVVRPGVSGDLIHNSVFIVIDGDGIDRVELHGAATPASAVVAEIRDVLRQPAVPRATGPRLWLAEFRSLVVRLWSLVVTG